MREEGKLPEIGGIGLALHNPVDNHYEIVPTGSL
jgi:hypothetical protein